LSVINGNVLAVVTSRNHGDTMSIRMWSMEWSAFLASMTPEGGEMDPLAWIELPRLADSMHVMHLSDRLPHDGSASTRDDTQSKPRKKRVFSRRHSIET